jgi:hypothetical protein
MTRLARVLVLLALGAGCGSSTKARSLLPVDITASPDVGTIAQVEVVITQGADTVTTKKLPWTAAAGQPLKVGLYLPDYVDGAVAVDANALDASDQVIGAATPQPATVHSGQTSEVVSLHIDRKGSSGGDGGVEPDGAVPPDGGVEPDGATVPDAGDAATNSDVPPDAGAPDVPTGLTWGPAENLEHDSLSRSRQPNVAIDGQGNVLVAWSEGTGIRTKRWDAATKMWGDAKMVENHGDINTVSLGMGVNGHATIVWNQYPPSVMPTEAGLWASHSKDGGNTWSPPHLVHNGQMYYRAALAVSRDGHARAAWEESPTGSNTDSLWSASYDDVTGTWSNVAMVKLGNNSYERYPKIAMDAKGNGILVWIQGEDPSSDASTYGASFTVNQPLVNVQVLDTLMGFDTESPAVAMTSDGSKGVAIWVQTGNSGYDLDTADFVNGAWKAPEKMMSFPSFVSDPAVVLDQAATLTAIWSQPLTSGKSNLVAARRAAGQPWGAPTALETTNQAGGYTDEDPIATAGRDSAGNVFVAWSRKLKPDRMEFSFGIVTRRFAGGTWQPEQALAMKDGIRASDPELAVAEDGRAAIAFYYYDPNNTGDVDTFNTFAILFR